jgi:hypothetical protein
MDIIYYIDFLNKDKGFKVDRVTFTGHDSYEDCVCWGRENLENFNLDMVKIVFLETSKED